ncbi:MAG: hypothetical protein WDN75_04690 [Bacteroidota bacterium]
MMPDYFQLPDIVTLEDHNGNFPEFLAAVYSIYKKDFIDSKPVFRTRKLGLKRFPIIDGMEKSFYHFTHEGDIENERIPDLRRMERMSWPSPMINKSEHTYLKVWKNKRGTSERILIFHEDENYLVILDDRKEYLLPWTAYFIKHDHKKRSLLKEYQAYIKAEAAQN